MQAVVVFCLLFALASGFPSAGLPTFTQTPVTAPNPSAPACSGAPQATTMRGVHYFLPTKGAAIVTYTVASKAWGSIPIPTDSPVAKMLDGASFAGVAAAVPGIDDYLVVSGGRSKNVVAYSIQSKTWTNLKGLSNDNANACSMGCSGYWMMMTGDIKKGENKPQTRQVYRYNISSGEAYENNGEKQRGGATCGCADNRAFWAGGFSNSGLSSNVETWGVDPFHRSGEPEFGLSSSRRDVGGGACGGLFVVVGGRSKSALNSVDVFNASDDAGGKPISTFDMSEGLVSPRMACLQDRYVLISGGIGSKGCNTQILGLDTQQLPASGSALSALPGGLSAKGQVAVATDGGSNAMFFDGTNGDLLSI